MEGAMIVQHAVATGIVLLLLLGVALLWEFWKVDRLNERKEKAMAERMRAEAELWNISPSQVRLLETFVPYVGSKHAMGIFTSPRLFETALDRFLADRAPSTQVYDDVRALREHLHFSQLDVDVELTSSRQIPIGAKVDFGPEGRGTPYSSVVEEIDDRSWAIRRVDKAHAKRGDYLVVRYFRPGDGDYRIPARVSEATGSLFRLEHTLELEHSQMRNWVRVRLCEPVEIRLLDAKNAVWGRYSGFLSDMSGGGVSFKTVEQIPVGSTVELEFAVRGHRFPGLRAKVLRSVPVQNVDFPLFVQSVEFAEMPTSERERLVRYVFDRGRSEG